MREVVQNVAPVGLAEELVDGDVLLLAEVLRQRLG